MSKVLDKLEGKGWVMRSAKPEDNRVQLLSLTSQGRRILPDLTEIADSNDRAFFNCLNTVEQTTLKTLLQKLAQAHGWNDVPMD